MHGARSTCGAQLQGRWSIADAGRCAQRGAPRPALSPTFPAGEMVFFIPWGVGRRTIRRGALRLWWRAAAQADEVAGGADSILRYSGSGGDAGAWPIGANDDAAAVELPGHHPIEGRRRQVPAAIESPAPPGQTAKRKKPDRKLRSKS
jgi:hypothetical protein